MLFVLLLAISSHTIADTYEQGLEVSCSAEELLINGFDLSNGVPEAKQREGSRTYFNSEPHKESCTVGTNAVMATFDILKPQPRGECGAMPGAILTLSINGEVYLQRSSLNHGCFTTLDSVKVNKGWHVGGFQLTVCGHTTSRQVPRFDGCVTVDEHSLKRMEKPIRSHFPVTAIIRQLNF
jgi:hypothetical protein